MIEWYEYQQELEYRYLVEDRTLEDLVNILYRDHNISVTKRTLLRKFKQWDCSKYMKGLVQNTELQELISRLWLQHFSPREILHALSSHGFNISLTQLKKIRLHSTMRLLTRQSPTATNDIQSQLEEVISAQEASGQAIRYGQSYMRALIRSQGLFVSDRYLQNFMRERNPQQADLRARATLRRRGQFEIKGPNRVWSIDGHDKLSPFGFQIYASIDAYSRKIIWCYVGHSNRTAVSVNKQFLVAIRLLNLFPKLVRSDMGGETVLLCNSQLLLRRHSKPNLEFRKAYSYGTSTRNQRIESWWNLLANAQTDTWRAIFGCLRETGYYNGGMLDEACLQFIYMSMIRRHIATFVETHNQHKIRHQRNRAHYLPTGRPNFLYHYPPAGIHDYGEPPSLQVLAALEADVAPYDLDEYLPDTIRLRFTDILFAGGFPIEYQFNEGHLDAYRYLRSEMLQYMQLNPLYEFQTLSRPLGVETWLQRYGNLVEIEQEGNTFRLCQLEMQLIPTDDEGPTSVGTQNCIGSINAVDENDIDVDSNMDEEDTYRLEI
ncbi:hypothetical protein DFH27DRAFT_486409 [Peziza echinospora]|nr:hypothetical protein DFH27DRAFT_486409 [Peziza echinospora]